MVIDVNFNGSFEIGLNIGVLIAELLPFDFYSLIFMKPSDIFFITVVKTGLLQKNITPSSTEIIW